MDFNRIAAIIFPTDHFPFPATKHRMQLRIATSQTTTLEVKLTTWLTKSRQIFKHQIKPITKQSQIKTLTSKQTNSSSEHGKKNSTTTEKRVLSPQTNTKTSFLEQNSQPRKFETRNFAVKERDQ